jgi:hypothetical protein
MPQILSLISKIDGSKMMLQSFLKAANIYFIMQATKKTQV